ncbi:hypothetical protein NL676_021351 [Syzygium grande]|nr:hypothetical protein NL676_021351 [Syzygium grande]
MPFRCPRSANAPPPPHRPPPPPSATPISASASQSLGGQSRSGRVIGPSSLDKIIKNAAVGGSTPTSVSACKSALDMGRGDRRPPRRPILPLKFLGYPFGSADAADFVLLQTLILAPRLRPRQDRECPRSSAPEMNFNFCEPRPRGDRRRCRLWRSGERWGRAAEEEEEEVRARF